MSVSSARFWIAHPVIQLDTVSGAILKWLAKVRCGKQWRGQVKRWTARFLNSKSLGTAGCL
jgi:hypothetical protein